MMADPEEVRKLRDTLVNQAGRKRYPSESRKYADALIAAGVHPLSRRMWGAIRLGPEGETCGSCAYLEKIQPGNKSYHKCGLRITYSAASDIRKWWPACTEWYQVISP
jgi:acetyl esterase/lipase